MDLVLYKNFSVENTIGKNKTVLHTYPGEQAVDTVNDVDIQVRMNAPHSQIRWDAANYFQWDGAFYYLDSVEYVNSQTTLVNGRMDLLETYASAIRGLKVVPTRTTSNGSSRLIDDLAPVSVDSVRTITPFPEEIDGSEAMGTYVLVTAQKGLQQV